MEEKVIWEFGGERVFFPPHLGLMGEINWSHEQIMVQGSINAKLKVFVEKGGLKWVG